MTTQYVGLSDSLLREDVFSRLNAIHRAHQMGAAGRANQMFSIMLFLLGLVLQEDIKIDDNPALTDWRLDSLNEAIQSHVENLNIRSQSQWMNVPDLVADWSSVPARLTVSKHRSARMDDGPLIGA